MNVVIFRENTEDVYAGIEWQEGSSEVAKVIEFLDKEMGKKISLAPAAKKVKECRLVWANQL